MNVVNLLEDVQKVLDKYGIDRVKETILFLDRVSSRPSNHVVLRAYTGAYVTITTAQFDELNNYVTSVPSEYITAIKKLREFTGTGLKEAKDIIETTFKNKRQD